MKEISDKVMEFLRDQYERQVYDFVDDPDEVCESPEDAVEYYRLLVQVGQECDLEFWSVALHEVGGVEGRLDRVKEYLAEGGLDV